MNVTKVLSTAILCLLPGAIVPAYAAEHEQGKQPAEHQQQAKPAQHQQQARPAQRQQQAKPSAARARQAKPAQQPQRAARTQQAKPSAARAQRAKPAQQTQRAARTQRTTPARQQQRGQAQQASRGRSTGGHGSIPEARYRASFGSGHTFHVNRSEFANGSGRFQYGGYWFNALDPWPAGWLYTDNVYVAYLNGGYFLVDPVHPGVYLSINIG